MSYNYDVLKERNKREKFALDLCDMLIKKYFDKTDEMWLKLKMNEYMNLN